MKILILPLFALFFFTIFSTTAEAEQNELRYRLKSDDGQERVEVREGAKSVEGRLEERREVREERRARTLDDKTLPIDSSVEGRERVERRVKMASSTERRVEMQKDAAERMTNRAARVMEATANRLEKIVQRVDSRIEKVKAFGGSVSEAEQYSADAKMHIQEARGSIQALLQIDSSSGKAAENFTKVREVGALVKEHLKEARESLSLSIRSIKGSDRNLTPEGSSSLTQ